MTRPSRLIDWAIGRGLALIWASIEICRGEASTLTEIGVAVQDNLPGIEALPPLPRWLPGETVFSLVSRCHELSGHLLASRTCRALFGRAQQGCEHDLPSRLATFAERTHEAFGDARTLALERTVLPFYLPLRSPMQSEEDIGALATSRGGVLKFRLGILTSRFRGNHPLKACVACMARDSCEFGISYWRWEHQLPGIWVCREHGLALRQALSKSTGVARFGWLLPKSEGLAAPSWPDVDGPGLESLVRFSEFVLGWSRLAADDHFTAQGLARTYRLALGFGGWAADLSARQLASPAQALTVAVSRLRLVPELSALSANVQQAKLLLERLVRRPRGGTHPLNHLTLIAWLFPSWSAFRQAYESAADGGPASGDAAEPVPLKVGDVRQPTLLELLRQGHSVRAASTKVGIDAQTGASWAAAAGFRLARRPKVLKGNSIIEMAVALRRGADKADVAKAFAVSEQTVTRILRTVAGLQGAWHEARRLRAQADARAVWSAAVSEMPGAGLKAVRRLAPAAYAWLYRNDQAWLFEASRPASTSAFGERPPPARRVDWDARDQALSADVRRVGAAIAERDDMTRVALWQLYQVLPELKAKLGALDRLPLTVRAIEQATRRPRRRRPALALRTALVHLMQICIIRCMNSDARLKAEANLAALRAAELGLTQSMIAAAIGASQSQVSRILSGGGARRSRLFDDVCKYVFSITDKQARPAESDELKAALAEVWDGTPRHAKALALVIRSLGALSPHVPLAPTSRGKAARGAA